MSDEKLISVRAFSELMGCAESTVRKAITTDKLGEGVVWMMSGKRKVPKIRESIARENWAKNFSSANVQNPSLAEKLGLAATAVDNTMSKSKTMRSVYQAQLLKLEFETKSGALVSKDKVYADLFEFGIEMRDAILAVPDRCIDDVLNAPTREDAYNILHESLAVALEALADSPNRNIG